MEIVPANIKPEYNHSTLVNNPPFITNYPLFEPLHEARHCYKYDQSVVFNEQYSKDKTNNWIINGLIGTTILGIIYSYNVVLKKIKHCLKGTK